MEIIGPIVFCLTSYDALFSDLFNSSCNQFLVYKNCCVKFKLGWKKREEEKKKLEKNVTLQIFSIQEKLDI